MKKPIRPYFFGVVASSMTTFVVAPEKPLGLHTHTEYMCREPHRHRRSEKQSQASLDVEAPSVLTSVVDLPNELAEKHFYILDTFPPCSFSELDFVFQIGRADRHTHRNPVSGVSYLMEKVRWK